MKTAAFVSAGLLFLLTTGASAQVQNARRAAAPDAGGTAVATDYRLVSGDKLRIEVYKDPQLSQALQVRPDGKITLPLVGDVPAAGKTSLELRDHITSALKEYITSPVVTVIVVETVPQVIHVMGEVNTAGPQALSGPLTVLQALAAAGGFKDFAKTKDIQILRKTGTGTTTLHFNYKDAVNGRAKMVMLQPNDTVIVK